MKILSPATAPWRSRIERRHEPRPLAGLYGYREYRPCLRWEFGFSCAFCLCHEADLSPYGRRTEVEHFVPVSHDQEQENNYFNCFLVCPFCNQSRGAAPNQDPAGPGRLLNPCEEAWREFFYLREDQILPREENADAVYTRNTYDLNDPRKVKMRELRRLTISAGAAHRSRFQELHARLLAKAKKTSEPELVDMAEKLWELRKPVEENLARFQAVPWNADTSCRCGHTRHHSLPDVLEEQTWEFDL